MWRVARIAILTASDKGAAGDREDASGDLAERRCREGGHDVVARAIVADDREAIAAKLREWADAELADWVIATGGTGLTERDVTPGAARGGAESGSPGVAVGRWL